MNPKPAWFRPVLSIRGCVSILSVAFFAFAAHHCHRGYQQCRPARLRATAEEASRAKLLFPSLTELVVQSADNLGLKAWYVAPRNGACIVLVPGLGGNRASMLDEAEVFARHGYGALLLEPRAHGDSGGSTATWGTLEADDVIRAVKLAYAQTGVTSVGALGFSVGASAVALAAARDPSIRAVVLYATWTSLREEILHKTPHHWRLSALFTAWGYELAGAHLDSIVPERELKRVSPRPILLLSGGRDEDTPPAIMDRVLAACGSPSELWRLPSVGHGGYLQAGPDEYERRVVGFWDRAFAKATTP